MVLERASGAVSNRLVTVGEASQLLNVHPNTLRKWSDKGLIPSYRIGLRRDRRFALEDLLAFLEVEANPREEHNQEGNGTGDYSQVSNGTGNE